MHMHEPRHEQLPHSGMARRLDRSSGIVHGQRSLSIEMMIGSYFGVDGVKRCRKGKKSYLPRPMPLIMHVHRRRCTRRSRKAIFRGPCRSGGKCLPSIPSSDPFQKVEDFDEVFPEEMPIGLPPIRGIEHQIDFVP
ncbi:hypothetical protein Q3G72_034175 [Acer saccharum]|nr:hypothetical protein Q3G72_034175 [Acer saccharum]